MGLTKALATFDVAIKESGDTKTLTFSKMLTSAKDLQELDITNEYVSACAVIFALAECEKDINAGKEMLEYINGPEDVSGFDINFIKEQIKQYPYLMRSYFNGTSVDNNYEVKNVSINVKVNAYSKDEAGYIKLWFKSTGADSERALTLRQKASTKEWFLSSDSYKGLMAGIRTPKAADKWA